MHHRCEIFGVKISSSIWGKKNEQLLTKSGLINLTITQHLISILKENYPTETSKTFIEV